MDKIIDKVLEIHRMKEEINQQVPTCSVADRGEVTWHVFGWPAFTNVATALNNGEFSTEDTGSGPYRWMHHFEYRGVTVFCLTHVRVPQTSKDW